MSIDPFVVFIVALTLVIGIGGLLIDAYGRKSDSDVRRREQD